MPSRELYYPLNRTLTSRSLVFLAALALSGCSGGSSGSAPIPAASVPIVQSTPSAAPIAPGTASVSIAIPIGRQPASVQRHLSYVPTGTQSVTVQVNSGALQPFNATGPTINASISGLSTGFTTFDIIAWTGTNGTGSKLSHGSTSATLNAGGNTLSITLNAIAASISVSNLSIGYGLSSPFTVAMTTHDAASNSITGPVMFDAPITVTSSDPANSPITGGATITMASQTITVTPSGLCAGPAMITATGGGMGATSTGNFGTNRHLITLSTDTGSGGVAGELRYLLANAATADIIVNGTARTVTLTSNLPTPAVSAFSVCSIAGQQLTVDGSASGYEEFKVPSAATAANFDTVTMQNGGQQSGSSYAGAISMLGTSVAMSINNCTFTNNKSSYGAGAIYGGGGLTVTNSTFFGNKSYSGGAIGWAGPILTVDSSTFTADQATAGSGGGISVSGGSLTITNATFTNESATSHGGAIADTSTSAATVSQDYFIQNVASTSGGAIYSSGTGAITVHNATFFQNMTTTGTGSAIAIGTSSTVAYVSFSTFSQNTAGSGGTLANPSGGTFNILANLMQQSAPNDLDANTFNSDGYNVIQNPGSALGLIGSDITASVALPAPANNGGPTKTIAITTGQTPYNIVTVAKCGANAGFPATPTDQRGTSYVRPHLGSMCSAGAYEP